MNKTLFFIALFFLTIRLSAQSLISSPNVATPNPGFENWTLINPPIGFAYDSVHNWQTLNYKTAALGTATAARATGVDKHSGQLAIKLTTKLLQGLKANGIVSTGNLITNPPYGVDGGIAFTDRPDSIVGWYKNTVVGSDTAFIELRLNDSTNTVRVGYATFDITSSHSTYQRFSAPIVYSLPSNPDLSIWLLSASAREEVNRQINSTLFVDDIDLIFNPVGISEAEKNLIHVFYNSDSHFIQVENCPKDDYILTLFSTDGKTVFQTKINQGNSSLTLNTLVHGTLFYGIFNSRSEKIKSGNLFVN